MNKRLAIVLAGLLVTGAVAMASGRVSNEVRYIQQNDGTNKYEITVAEGNVALTENIFFRFDLDRDIYQDNDDNTYQEGYDSDWGFDIKGGTVEVLGYEWKTGVILEYDWDTKKLRNTDRKPLAGTKYDDDEKTSKSQLEFKPYVSTTMDGWGLRISPEFYHENMSDEHWQVLDIQGAASIGPNWWIAVEMYNIFNNGEEDYALDFELYMGRTWNTPIENLNIHFEFGSENYGMFTNSDTEADIAVYGTPRIDYTIQAGPTKIVPYLAATRYEGNAYGEDYTYSEFGVEFTTKF